MFLLYVNRIPSRAGSSSLKIAAELGDRVRLLVSLPSFDRDFLVSGTRILDNAGHEPRPLLRCFCETLIMRHCEPTSWYLSKYLHAPIYSLRGR